MMCDRISDSAPFRGRQIDTSAWMFEAWDGEAGGDIGTTYIAFKVGDNGVE